MLAERITAFVRGAARESFERLALAVFRRQYERDASYRLLCERRGITPEAVTGWREVPVSPAAAAAEAEPPTDDPGYRELSRAAIEGTFPGACLAGLDRPPLLSLIRAGDAAEAGAAGFPAERILAGWGAPDSLAAARRGVEVARARGFLAARQRDRRPTVILAATAELDRLLEALERRGLRFRLPPGSRVVEIGRRGPASRQLLVRLADGLGVPPEAVVREYAAPGMVTRLFAGHGRRGEPRPFEPPPWARARILDSAAGGEAPAGSPGEIALFDLASAGSVAHRLTGDRGIADGGGFRLDGGQPPRGAGQASS